MKRARGALKRCGGVFSAVLLSASCRTLGASCSAHTDLRKCRAIDVVSFRGVDMTQLDLRGLTDDQLVCQLKKLVGADRALSVKLLVHLGELDERGVCRAQGYASTFEYAVRALHMSDAEAYLRIHAARLGRRFPRVLELFGQGELHLTAIKLLGPILTADNHV